MTCRCGREYNRSRRACCVASAALLKALAARNRSVRASTLDVLLGGEKIDDAAGAILWVARFCETHLRGHARVNVEHQIVHAVVDRRWTHVPHHVKFDIVPACVTAKSENARREVAVTVAACRSPAMIALIQTIHSCERLPHSRRGWIRCFSGARSAH